MIPNAMVSVDMFKMHMLKLDYRIFLAILHLPDKQTYRYYWFIIFLVPLFKLLVSSESLSLCVNL